MSLMNCKWRAYADDKLVCHLLGISYEHCCDACIANWTNGECCPNGDEKYILQIKNNITVNDNKTFNRQNDDKFTKDIDTHGHHNNDCVHRSSQPIDRTYNGEPCNCPNRWLYRCEHPDLSAYVPTTTLKQCRDCPFHEDVYPDDP